MGRYIGEVLQIRNPLRSPTDCSVSGIPYSLQEAIIPYYKGISLRVAALIKSYFFPCLLRFWYPPRISGFFYVPPPQRFCFFTYTPPPRISSKPPSRAKLP